MFLLRKVTRQSHSVTLLLISVGRLVLQDMELNFIVWQVVAHLKKTYLLTFFTQLQPFKLHRSRVLYFVDHKAWYSAYVHILSKAQKSGFICRNLFVEVTVVWCEFELHNLLWILRGSECWLILNTSKRREAWQTYRKFPNKNSYKFTSLPVHDPWI